MSRTWEIRLPWTAPPCSANDRDHWRVKARKVAEIRETARCLVLTQVGDHGEPMPERIRVGLTYTPRDNRRRDPDNLVVPLYKALVDGIVDSGLVVDDTPQYVERTFPVILPANVDAHLVLTIEEVDR